jgi:hypothetical protein
MANSKTVQYLNKDFDSLKAQLINFAQTYYPNTYNDFNEASPGMMLIEMASYVGDVLSFYIDNQIQENFLQFAKQRKNLLAQAYTFGYQPKVTKAASVVLSVYQVVPSTIASGQYEPDFNYALILEEGGKVSSNLDSNIQFFINEKLDFIIDERANHSKLKYENSKVNKIVGKNVKYSTTNESNSDDSTQQIKTQTLQNKPQQIKTQQNKTRQNKTQVESSKSDSNSDLDSDSEGEDTDDIMNMIQQNKNSRRYN